MASAARCETSSAVVDVIDVSSQQELSDVVKKYRPEDQAVIALAIVECLTIALSECRERERLLLADVDLALTHYGMATSATGGPAMGDKQKRKHFGEAVAALRRVRNSLAAQSPSEASDGD